MKAKPPGPARAWTEMLNDPWDKDPHVVVVMVPVGTKLSTRATPDGDAEFKCVEFDGGQVLGLQVTKPEVDSYWEQERVFEGMGARMIQPGHIGLLSEMPDRMLTTSDFMPLAFLSRAMSKPFLNIKKAVCAMPHLDGKQ